MWFPNHSCVYLVTKKARNIFSNMMSIYALSWSEWASVRKMKTWPLLILHSQFFPCVTFQCPCRAHKGAAHVLTWDSSTTDALPSSSSSFMEKGLTALHQKTLALFSPCKLTLFRLILSLLFQTVARKALCGESRIKGMHMVMALKLTSFSDRKPWEFCFSWLRLTYNS